MTDIESALHRVEQDAKQATREAAPWVEGLARFGYAAKGVVYILVGFLAFQAARGNGQPTDSRGALRSILSQPAGHLLMWLVAVGLFGYVVWKFVEAGLDPEAKSGFKRMGYAGSALIHAGLTLEAVRLAIGRTAGQDGDQRAIHWTATAMSYPLGRWAVVIVAIGIAAFGFQQLRNAYRAKLDKQLSLGSLSVPLQRWVVRTARLGLAARGVVFTIIGSFLLLAAQQTDPGEARGVEGALETVREQPYGPWLLGAVAVGLVAYGIYGMIRARYRRIHAA